MYDVNAITLYMSCYLKSININLIINLSFKNILSLIFMESGYIVVRHMYSIINVILITNSYLPHLHNI